MNSPKFVKTQHEDFLDIQKSLILSLQTKKCALKFSLVNSDVKIEKNIKKAKLSKSAAVLYSHSKLSTFDINFTLKNGKKDNFFMIMTFMSHIFNKSHHCYHKSS